MKPGNKTWLETNLKLTRKERHELLLEKHDKILDLYGKEYLEIGYSFYFDEIGQLEFAASFPRREYKHCKHVLELAMKKVDELLDLEQRMEERYEELENKECEKERF